MILSKVYETFKRQVSYKRYFRCNNCFLLLVYTIHLSLSTDLADPPPIGKFYMKHALVTGDFIKGSLSYLCALRMGRWSPLNECTLQNLLYEISCSILILVEKIFFYT